MDRKVVSAEDAVARIASGTTIAVSGNGEMVMPDRVLAALEARFLQEGEPRGLTAILPIVLGAPVEGRGADRLAHPGLLACVIGSSLTTLRIRRLNQLLLDGLVEGYHLPMGAVFHMLRATAGGKPGDLSRVGIGSFVDPRNGGGRVNAATTENLVEIVTISGEEFLFYPAPRVDTAIIRATSADEYGNLTFEDEAMTSGALTLAMAAKSSGGTTIAQVKRLVVARSLHPKAVVVPAPLVDAIVVDPNQQRTVEPYVPEFTGDIRTPLHVEPLPLDARKIVLRRALMELERGGLYNVGFGVPAELAAVLVEEGLFDEISLSVEHGPLGGVPYGKTQFGAAINPQAIMDTVQVFDMYDGGILTGTLLGMAQVDARGSVNVSNINGFRNIGGFIDIVHRTPTILFCGTFTSGGLQVLADSENGLHIVREGAHRKFVDHVAEESFASRRGLSVGQKVTYITERAVFVLSEGGLVLTEIAPGVDLERDVLGLMDFLPLVADPLMTMDARIFGEGPRGLSLRSMGGHQ